MAYDPGVQNHVGEYLMQGILQAGDSLGKGIAEMAEKRDQAKKEDEYSRAMLDYYHDAGHINGEEYAKALRGSSSARNAIITGVQADMHDQLTTQMEKQRLGVEYADLGEKKREFDSKQNNVMPVPVPGMEGYYVIPKTGELVNTKKGSIPVGSDPTGTGNYYFDGQRLAQKSKAQLDAQKEQQEAAKDAALAAAAANHPEVRKIDDQIEALQVEAAKSGRGMEGKSGPLGWFGKSYEKQIEDLQGQKEEMIKTLSDPDNPDAAEISADGQTAAGGKTPDGSQQTGGTAAPSGDSPAPAVQASAPDGGSSSSAGAGASGEDAPAVTSQEDFDKLASGAVYVGSDGKKYRKP